MLNRIILTVVIALTLIACDGSSDEGNTRNTNPGPDTNPTPKNYISSLGEFEDAA